MVVLSKGAIAGIVIACIIALVAAGVLTYELWFKYLHWGDSVYLSMQISEDDVMTTKYLQVNLAGTLSLVEAKNLASPFGISQPDDITGYLKTKTSLNLVGAGDKWLTTMQVQGTTWTVGKNRFQTQQFQLVPLNTKDAAARILVGGGTFLIAHLNSSNIIDGYVTRSPLSSTNSRQIMRILPLDPKNLGPATFTVAKP